MICLFVVLKGRYQRIQKESRNPKEGVDQLSVLDFEVSVMLPFWKCSKIFLLKDAIIIENLKVLRINFRKLSKNASSYDYIL